MDISLMNQEFRHSGIPAFRNAGMPECRKLFGRVNDYVEVTRGIWDFVNPG